MNAFNKYEISNKLSTCFYYFAILFFIIGFGFTDTPTPFGWYQQFMPNLNGRQIVDITFTDSLTGYAITNKLTSTDTSFVLKTINSGDNWSLISFDNNGNIFKRIKFINQNTGYIGAYNSIKTTNGGITWTQINAPEPADDIFVLNEDSIWIASSGNPTGGVFFTSNGGLNWTSQINIGSSNPDHIYMFNARIGFISKSGNTQLRKTTDGGQSWNLITGSGTGSFNDMYFIDSLTGWKCKTPGGGGWLMGKTTDGGFNWIEEIIPDLGNNSIATVQRFSSINKDTIWACGSYYFKSGQGDRAFLHRTVNGGDTWKIQIPDTSFQLFDLSYINFINKNNGWSYRVVTKGIHTVTGGDTSFVLSIKKTGNSIPQKFVLFQNYPNPFNPFTSFKLQVEKLSNIKIIMYDITGKTVAELVNKKLDTGEYKIDFDGSAYSSGVYFYSLFVNGNLIDTKKMILLK